MSRKEHLVDIPTSVGPITVIDTSRKTRPVGLRKPYEYVLPVKDANALAQKLRDALKGSESKGFQCGLASRKGLARGIRLDYFLLGYRVGLCGDSKGVSPALYGETVRAVQRLLMKYLGKDARVYAEPYSQDDKFQSRFETYIMFEEMK